MFLCPMMYFVFICRALVHHGTFGLLSLFWHVSIVYLLCHEVVVLCRGSSLVSLLSWFSKLMLNSLCSIMCYSPLVLQVTNVPIYLYELWSCRCGSSSWHPAHCILNAMVIKSRKKGCKPCIYLYITNHGFAGSCLRVAHKLWWYLLHVCNLAPICNPLVIYHAHA